MMKRCVQDLSEGEESVVIPPGFTPRRFRSYFPRISITRNLCRAFFPSVVWLGISLLIANSSQRGLSDFTSKNTATTDQPPEDHHTESNSDPNRIGVIYARVSSKKQAEQGNSIDRQIENLRAQAADLDIALPFDPIKDEGQTGTNFNRDGIKQVFEMARDEQITHLLVDEVDRIGRAAPETLYFIYLLQDDYDITIVTNTGPVDIHEIEDLISLTLRSLMSEIGNRERGRHSLETRIHRFKHLRNWSSYGPSVPFGYQETDDGWIEPIPNQTSAVTDLFKTYVETESFTATAEHIRDTYTFPGSDLSSDQVKRYLQKPLYIGKPTLNIDSEKVNEDEVVVTDSNLALIEPDLFHQVQEIIAATEDQNSSTNNTKAPLDFIHEFGWNPVVNLPDVAVICPTHDCNAIMVKNGQRTLTGGDSEHHVHNYLCRACGKQRKFPTQAELQTIKANASQ